jgi:outer membrane protein assembly factor BamD (BamD/ComL family)
MSVAGIASTALFSILNGLQGSSQKNGAASNAQQFEAMFQEIGEDLQSGNLTQAQQDYATFSQDFPGLASAGTAASSGSSGSTGSGASGNPLASAFSALSQALQSGNLSAAQQDYSTIRQDFQQQGAGRVHGHHHHGGGEGQQIGQEFPSLSQALQSGNLSAAQSAFATLQQDLEAFDPADAAGSIGSGASTAASFFAAGAGNNLSVVA